MHMNKNNNKINNNNNDNKIILLIIIMIIKRLLPSQGASEWVGKWYFGVELYFGYASIPGLGSFTFSSYEVFFLLKKCK